MQEGTYFSSKDDIQSVLLEALNTAKTDIKVVVAWFTDRTLFEKLIEKQKKGINVGLIIANHEINHQCGINYDRLAAEGGEVIFMGDAETGLMHNKFCVIDYDIICMGSYNWTNSARTRNKEVLDVSTGNLKKADSFIQEYNRLSELSGKSVEFSVPDLSETIQIFALIKGFINLKQPNMITPYLYQLQPVDEVAHILEKLQNQEYDTAIVLMDDFTANYTRPVSVTQRELASVKFRIKFLSYQVESLDAEKVETQTELEQFNHRCVIELNPIILKILELKKKIFHKLRKYGVDDSTYEDLENEFRERNQEYEEESENPIADLNEDDQKSIKQLQKEGVRLCHPDSPECVYEDKKEAATMFDNLFKAYKANDIEEVKRLVQHMRLGKVSETTDDYTELEMLKAKLASLEQKYKTLLEELVAIKSSEDFQKMPPQEEWDEYFKEAKRQLQDQLEQLKKDYTTPEKA